MLTSNQPLILYGSVLVNHEPLIGKLGQVMFSAWFKISKLKGLIFKGKHSEFSGFVHKTELREIKDDIQTTLPPFSYAKKTRKTHFVKFSFPKKLGDQASKIHEYIRSITQ